MAEGIMALPQAEAPMGEMPPAPLEQPPTMSGDAVSSMDAQDAAEAALASLDPNALAQLKVEIQAAISELDLEPEEIDQLIMILESMATSPEAYMGGRAELIRLGIDPEDIPPEFSPPTVGLYLMLLNEMKRQKSMPMAQEPVQMAGGGLTDVAQALQSMGRNGDTMLAHITPEEAMMLKSMGGSGTINPRTGLPEFFLKKLGRAISRGIKSIGKAVKKIANSTVGRIALTVGATLLLGPAGMGLSLSTAAAAGAGLTTLAGGGNLKDALFASAMGYLGGGGTVMGYGTTGATALGTALKTGAAGALLGKATGMSTQQALKAGLTAGATAGALQGYQNMVGAEQAPAAVESRDFGYAGEGLKQAGAPGAVGDVGPVGTAANYPYDGAAANAMAAPAGTAVQQSAVTAPVSSAFELAPGLKPQMGLAGGADLTAGTAASGGTGAASAASQSFIDKALSYFVDPTAKTSIGRYVTPASVLTGYALLQGTGAFEPPPMEPIPEQFQRTGADVIQENPEQYRSFAMPQTYPTETLVPTPGNYGFAPAVAQTGPTTYTPTGITALPTAQEMVQPYNQAGLYGVPLIYASRGSGPSGVQNFPRKNGHISGPGTGTSDDIPAMLSDGEFVFTAKAVRNMGNGSRRKGAARMYKMMKMLEGGPVGAKRNA